MAKRKSADVEQWPVLWRVTAPVCGGYDHDMVLLETEDEGEARKRHASLRRDRWPVRLERVKCGPLPAGAKESLKKIRATNAQSPGTSMREVPAYWTQQ